ncbi:phosphoadenosine phosphosulfate reductase family protein [Sphingomonas histidinilytica]|uniref:phosphoadenosine phosphosulfate reductase domain-containing protein n=1 Tax=Rhizorhabdus histidinilytica TaxID=439228 RepID=UPI001AD9CE2C|nr:phosphoadenosine phosphosulfate reductase family protein [Rhizorhabdus histidinilytica]MBO9375520.1 phosphoadenosine phosphosulfate reductase family protein [Rhizorhabdus histidinilytica]
MPKPCPAIRPCPGSAPAVALDPAILAAIERNACFAFSLSGGKDSTVAAHATIALLDRVGHPPDRRLAVHADLGRAEWRSTPATVDAVAARLGLPLLVVRRGAGDMVARWEQRFESGKRRYEALETYNLIGPWSSSSLRFCTSEMKAQIIGPELARRFRGETIVSVVGLRREESAARRATPISRIDERFAKARNQAGTRMISWHPLVDWTADQVFAAHERHDLPLHEAYCRYHSTRLSCAFCVLASGRDLEAASRASSNRDLYRHLVSIEAQSTFSFQQQRWLADVAPGLLPASLQKDIERAKRDAAGRRHIEAAMPVGLRFVKGWPPRMPSLAESTLIAAARTPILRRHKLDDLYPDAAAVRTRFAALIAAKHARATKTAIPRP